MVVLSSWAQTGSEGWVPRSKATLQSSSVGGEVVRLYALTLTSGLLSGSSTTATTSSGVPSSSRSARSGCSDGLMVAVGRRPVGRRGADAYVCVAVGPDQFVAVAGGLPVGFRAGESG